MKASLAWAGAACLLLVAGPSPLIAQTAPHDGLVLLQRTVDTRYRGDSAQTTALLASPLSQEYVVKQGDSLEKIVSQLYGVGPRATPELFAKVATRIQALNHLSDVDVVPAGAKLEMPDLPPLQWKERNPANLGYGVPRLQSGASYKALLQGKTDGLMGLGDARKIFDLGRRAEPLVTQWRWVTVEEAKAELTVASGSVPITLWSQPITLKLAQAAPAATGAGMVADVAFLRKLLARHQPGRDVVLFVLDDSWPSDALFDASRNFIVRAIDAVRQRYILGPSSLDKAITSGQAKTNFPAHTSGRVSHAQLISTSLGDFVVLSPRVNVVYLPLFTEQTWSKEIWQELTYIALVTSALHGRLGEFGPSPDIAARAAVDAKNLVAMIPSKAIDALGPAQQTPITVLEKFAQLYAQATGMPFYISMSWTVEEHAIDFGPDANALGVSLAATGNDRKDVVQEGIYLALRGKAAPGDVLAVMNTDSSGMALCGSNTLPLSSPNPFYGLAYDGRIGGGGGECGTSFSTPRVGWLLALRQAYEAPIQHDNWPDWYGSYRTPIANLQGSSQAGVRRYWLNVPKLFDGL